MADLGLLLQDDLALAAFEGRKTVSRRPVATQPTRVRLDADGPNLWSAFVEFADGSCVDVGLGPRVGVLSAALGPAVIRGAGTAEVGGRVWVRECWAVYGNDDGHPINESGGLVEWGPGCLVGYRASGDVRPEGGASGWRPSIHMPKWASRTWGRITSVTPCDLSTIDHAEAKREGFETAGELKAALRSLYPAATWFWRIEWERIETPEDPNA